MAAVCLGDGPEWLSQLLDSMLWRLALFSIFSLPKLSVNFLWSKNEWKQIVYLRNYNNFFFGQVAKPRVGESHPAQVRADVTVNLSVRPQVKKEWEGDYKSKYKFNFPFNKNLKKSICILLLWKRSLLGNLQFLELVLNRDEFWLYFDLDILICFVLVELYYMSIVSEEQQIMITLN